jgi:hypothetical protein
MSSVVAVISDTHIGSFTSLSLPEWNMDTGEIDAEGQPITKKVLATPAQNWLLDKWHDYWDHAKKLCGKKHRLIVVHLGDIVDGIHHQSAQILPNLIDQEGMAIELLKPVANMASRMFICRGTATHVREMGGSEVTIARELGASSAFEYLLDIDGTVIDCAHHGRAARRDWTSVAASVATQTVMTAAMDNPPRIPPRYVFRGHNHIFDDSGEKVRCTRAIAMSSWQLRTEYGYRIAAGTLSDIGGLFILPDGQLDLSRIRYYEAPGQRQMIKV